MKRLSLSIACLAALIFFASVSYAAIRSVGLNQTYTTLTSAYNAAVNDDTLLISPGVYSETITSAKRLHWIGAGYDEVLISAQLYLNAGSTGTTIEGINFTVVANVNQGVFQIAGGVDLIRIERCIIRNNRNDNNWHYCIFRSASPGGIIEVNECILDDGPHQYYGIPLVLNGDNATIRNCVLTRSNNSATSDNFGITGNPNSLTVENCVVVGISTMFQLPTNFSPFIVRNNVFHDWTSGASWGTYPGGGSGWSYNASSTIAPPGANGILLPGDPFVSYDETANYIYGSSDLHLAAGSPCIDTGDPAILDLDNSRSDMGIYGGQTPHVDGGAPNYPFAIDLTIPSSISAGQQLPIQATGRIGAGY